MADLRWPDPCLIDVWLNPCRSGSVQVHEDAVPLLLRQDFHLMRAHCLHCSFGLPHSSLQMSPLVVEGQSLVEWTRRSCTFMVC
ncbi:hypothetical protein U9M48_011321 [Paspalum notatum var. saurae]|uniref:Uncharacterized protein n=1 Tax=Paspalum notatum var. saurae TaxID=547442 RepID=A0AAQ3WHC9_PASNO